MSPHGLTYKQYFKSSKNLYEFLQTVVRLIVTFDSVCVSTNDDLLLWQLPGIISGDNRTVVMNNFVEFKQLGDCVCSVLLGEYHYEDLAEYRAHVNTPPTKSMFLISNRSTTNLTSWQSLTTPEVVYVDLQSNSLYQLSPEFPRPRNFLPTSVAEVTGGRLEQRTPTNFQGEKVSFGITKLPPHLIFKEGAVRVGYLNS